MFRTKKLSKKGQRNWRLNIWKSIRNCKKNLIVLISIRNLWKKSLRLRWERRKKKLKLNGKGSRQKS